MNELNTNNNGGYPWLLDDFRWSDDQIRHFINNFLDWAATGTNRNFIVTGCEVSIAGTTAINSGYVWLNSEILFSDGASGLPNAGAGFTYAYAKVTGTDSSGTKTMRNASTFEAYQKDRAVASLIATPIATSKLDYQGKRLPNEPWISVTANGTGNSYDFDTANWLNNSGTSVLKFSKCISTNSVCIRGLIKNSAIGGGAVANSTIFTLPADYRPDEDVFTVGTVGNLDVPAIITVGTDGTVKFSTSLYVNNDSIAFGEIRVRL